MRSAPTRSLPIALLLSAIVLLVSAASAAAATIPIKGGEVDWGVKESFRKYVKGPIADGKIEVSGGAVEAADGTFRFPISSGKYDLTTHVTEVQATGTIHFTGHYEGTPTPQLDVTITDPRVIFGGETGTVFADVSSKAFSPGEPEGFPNAEFAALDTGGVIPGFSSEAVTMTAIPAKLTKEGSEAFAGFYSEGTGLDPVSLTATFEPTPAPEPKKEEPKPADPPPAPTPTLTMPTLKPSAGASKLGGGGSATVATITCASTEPCTVLAPKNVKFKVGGKSFNVKVIAPKWILAGKSGKVTVKVPKSALEELGGGKAKISLNLVLGTGTQSTTEVVKATLKGQAS
jgi:Htaa